jgi:hypothetical protein
MKNWKQWTFVVVIVLFGIMVGFIACVPEGENPDGPFTLSGTVKADSDGNIVFIANYGNHDFPIIITTNLAYPNDSFEAIDGEKTIKGLIPSQEVTWTAECSSIEISLDMPTHDPDNGRVVIKQIFRL